MLLFWIFLLCYLLLISMIASIAALVDKRRARRGGWRVAERTLLWLGAAGGALAEWFVLRRVRHKTTRKKFMVTLPLLALCHTALLGCLLYFFPPW